MAGSAVHYNIAPCPALSIEQHSTLCAAVPPSSAPCSVPRVLCLWVGGRGRSACSQGARVRASESRQRGAPPPPPSSTLFGSTTTRCCLSPCTVFSLNAQLQNIKAARNPLVIQCAPLCCGYVGGDRLPESRPRPECAPAAASYEHAKISLLSLSSRSCRYLTSG